MYIYDARSESIAYPFPAFAATRSATKQRCFVANRIPHERGWRQDGEKSLTVYHMNEAGGDGESLSNNSEKTRKKRKKVDWF